MLLGRNISRYRKLNNMKSADLAKQVGVGQPYISEIETGKKLPSIEVLQKISKALNTTTSELLGETAPKFEDNIIRLADAAKGLNSCQIDAVINLINSFTYTSDNSFGNLMIAEDMEG